MLANLLLVFVFLDKSATSRTTAVAVQFGVVFSAMRTVLIAVDAVIAGPNTVSVRGFRVVYVIAVMPLAAYLTAFGHFITAVVAEIIPVHFRHTLVGVVVIATLAPGIVFVTTAFANVDFPTTGRIDGEGIGAPTAARIAGVASAIAVIAVHALADFLAARHAEAIGADTKRLHVLAVTVGAEADVAIEIVILPVAIAAEAIAGADIA